MKTGSDYRTFLKAQCTSLAASGVDYVVYGLLYYVFGIWYLAATVTGLVAGGIVSFMMGRNWVFQKGKRSMKIQALLYIAVWYGSLLLNTAGVYLVTEGLHIDPTISKILVSVAVGISYNYLLQKHLVFK